MDTNNVENPAIVLPLDLAKKTIEELYTKYADDPYVFSKMHNYVCWKLPAVIEDMKRANEERKARNDILSTEQDTFINAFLNTNQYFHCSLTDRYFLYDGIHYQLRREDDVLHHILTTITKEHNALIPRKPQTKVYVMKRVKESNPLKSTPESVTIQLVLDALCPAFFTTKHAAKYFLTIIGDHLLKKTDEATHYFASPKAKDFLRELGSISQNLFGVNATALFKHKYHYHAYKTIRLVKFGDTAGVDAVWRSILSENAVDLCCVAAHYSGRYESADQYLEQYADEPELVRYALYFRGKQAKDVVEEFVADYLLVSNVPTAAAEIPAVSLYTMDYLWKKYLKDRQFPAVLGPPAVTNMIVEQIPAANYDHENKQFIGVSSPHLLMIERFHRFWEECVVDDFPSDSQGSQSRSDCFAAHNAPLGTAFALDEYEIDEMTAMYREWSGCTFRMTDSQMLDLIRFYKKVDIVDGKYVQGLRCSLWDKQTELDRFFENLREGREDIISFYDAYNAYKTKRNMECVGGKRIISKPYFEKYIFITFADFVLDGKMLSCEWSKKRTT